MILFLKILGGVAALVLGLYLGGGGYTQSPEDVAARLGKGQPRKAKRHFMWINYFNADPRASERRRDRKHFKTAVARDKSEERSEE